MKRTLTLIFLALCLTLSLFGCGEAPVTTQTGTEGTGTTETLEATEEKEPIDFSNMIYSAIGDSITFGRDINDPFPLVVKDILGFRRAINYGIGSSTLTDTPTPGRNPMVLRYEKINKDSDIISIQGGGNDYASLIPIGTPDSTDIRTFYGGLKALYGGLRKNHPDAFIFVITPTALDVTWDDNQKMAAEYQEYRDVIVEVAAMYDFPVLDFWALPDYLENTFDGVHPTQKYVTYTLAPMIADFIKENYKKPN